MPDLTSSQTKGGGSLAREDSASSKKSKESVFSEGSSLYPPSAKKSFKKHKDTVDDIMSEIGQLQIFKSGDVPLEDLLARPDIPENATILQDFRQGVKSGDITSPVSSPCTPSSPYYISCPSNIRPQPSPPSSLLSRYPSFLRDPENCSDVREKIRSRPLFMAVLYHPLSKLRWTFIPVRLRERLLWPTAFFNTALMNPYARISYQSPLLRRMRNCPPISSLKLTKTPSVKASPLRRPGTAILVCPRLSALRERLPICLRNSFLPPGRKIPSAMDGSDSTVLFCKAFLSSYGLVSFGDDIQLFPPNW
ncbi:unnamed protein product [Tuber aestivum]|uniref:Uncharacterized protein n=1 Tax=Tuber aestivum TaxID=59557 RepID=A0A292PN92_9PEZI|nr:unnamed protein product [Tuber aestivum]